MKWERREIKNFRLKYRLDLLKTVFESNQNTALFLTLNNKSKIDLKKEINDQNIILKSISKKAIGVLCKSSNNLPLKNLLTGNVILLQPNTNLDLSKLLLSKEINLNVLISNQAFYRNKEQILTAPKGKDFAIAELAAPTKNLLKLLYLIKKLKSNSVL